MSDTVVFIITEAVCVSVFFNSGQPLTQLSTHKDSSCVMFMKKEHFPQSTSQQTPLQNINT